MKPKKIAANLSFVLKNLLAIVVMLMIVLIVLSPALRQKDIGKVKESDKNSDIKPIPVQEKIIVPKIIYNLSGKITKIDGNTVVFNAEINNVNEKGVLIESREEERRAIVNSTTKISSLSFVDRSPVDKKINFSDLKSGDYAEIISSSDISNAKEFLATQIRIKTSL